MKCPRCEAGDARAWDSDLEWFAHPQGSGKWAVCEEPWRAQDTVASPAHEPAHDDEDA